MEDPKEYVNILLDPNQPRLSESINAFWTVWSNLRLQSIYKFPKK